MKIYRFWLRNRREEIVTRVRVRRKREIQTNSQEILNGMSGRAGGNLRIVRFKGRTENDKGGIHN